MAVQAQPIRLRRSANCVTGDRDSCTGAWNKLRTGFVIPRQATAKPALSGRFRGAGSVATTLVHPEKREVTMKSFKRALLAAAIAAPMSVYAAPKVFLDGPANNSIQSGIT